MSDLRSLISKAKRHPSTINREKGVVIQPSNFYSGKSVVLNTFYGELVLFSSSNECIKSASNLIMPDTFELDIDRAQDVSIFETKKVTVTDIASSEAGLIKSLQADKKLLRNSLLLLVEVGLHEFYDAEDRINFDNACKVLEETK